MAALATWVVESEYSTVCVGGWQRLHAKFSWKLLLLQLVLSNRKHKSHEKASNHNGVLHGHITGVLWVQCRASEVSKGHM